jgi:hypothetical protein
MRLVYGVMLQLGLICGRLQGRGRAQGLAEIVDSYHFASTRLHKPSQPHLHIHHHVLNRDCQRF